MTEKIMADSKLIKELFSKTQVRPAELQSTLKAVQGFLLFCSLHLKEQYVRDKCKWIIIM